MSTDSSMRNDIWKWLSLLIIAIFSIYVTFPVKEKMRFGLDLKGGTSFTLGVDDEKLRESIIADNPAISNDTAAIERKIQETLNGADPRIIQVVRRRVDGMGMNEPVIQGLKNHRLLVQLPGIDEETRRAAKKSLQSAAFLEFRLTHPQNSELVSKLMSSKACPEGYELGGKCYVRATNYNEVASRPGYAARLASFHVPDRGRYQFMLQKEEDASYTPSFVSRMPPAKERITGEYLTSAWVERDPVRGLAINFRFDSKGARLFSEVTRNYMAGGPKNRTGRGRQLAIILDDTLVSAPVIQSEIGAEGQITGSFTPAEAQQLANDLNAGALPAPLKLLAESSVSPTVGEDAKQAGIVAATLGFLLVGIFMLIYYWYAGLVADIALFLDVALLPAALVIVANILGVFAKDASMGATGSIQLPVLTMPGIAGLVLTLGMAVDANVIIFERIREEFLARASTGAALKNGYGRAFTAILDSNITTIVTGIILFIVGTGPVRGFAITLTAGVLISMFTAVVVTRLVFDNTTKPESMKPFKMLNVFKKVPNVNFVAMGKITLIASAAIIVVSLAIFFIRAATNRASVLAVDLTGGTSLVYSVDQAKKPAVGDVRKALDKFDNATVIQYQEGVGDATLLVKTGETAETGDGRDGEGQGAREPRRGGPRHEAAPGGVPRRGPQAGVRGRGRLDGGRGPQEVRHLGRDSLALRDPDLRGVPLRVRIRPRRARGARARRAHLAGSLLALRTAGVASRDNGAPHDHRLLGERYDRRVRPHPRGLAQGSEDRVQGSLQPGAQRVPEPHGDHVGDDVLRGGGAVRVRRRVDLRLRAHDAHRRRSRCSSAWWRARTRRCSSRRL